MPPIIRNKMRPRSKSPPKTPAQRQRKCRAIKRGDGQWHAIPAVCVEQTLPGPNLTGPPAALPAPAAPVKTQPALPAPPTAPVTAIQKAVSAGATGLALPDAGGSGDAWRL